MLIGNVSLANGRTRACGLDVFRDEKLMEEFAAPPRLRSSSRENAGAAAEHMTCKCPQRYDESQPSK